MPEKQASEDRDIALDSRYLALDSRYPALDRYLTLDKKLRNKLAAKDSRERKRRYIELLEG